MTEARIFAETKRLILRQLTRADLPRMIALVNHPEIVKWLVALPQPYTMQHAEELLGEAAAASAKGAPDYFVLAEKDGGQLIGGVRLYAPLGRPAEPGEAVIAYWLGQAYWGRGFIGEALPAVLACGFAWPAIAKITATTSPDHDVSIRVLRKAGFAELGLFPRTETTLRGGQTVIRWELTRDTYRLAP